MFLLVGSVLVGLVLVVPVLVVAVLVVAVLVVGLVMVLVTIERKERTLRYEGKHQSSLFLSRDRIQGGEPAVIRIIRSIFEYQQSSGSSTRRRPWGV